jgi:DNA-binding transcriptional LysR family regulator
LTLSLTLRQLEYAVAIARFGGLTAAAAALHVSQPALTVALAQLEALLGQNLFLRRPGAPLTPTGFGAAWLGEAATQLEGVAALMQAPRKPALRLAIFEDLAPTLLAPLLARAADEGITVQARPMGFADLGQALSAGSVDAAIGWELGLPPGLILHPLAQIAPQAVLTPDHPLAVLPDLGLADLAGQPLVLTDQDHSIAHIQILFHAAGLPCLVAHRCATLDLMRSYAANGLGVGLSYTQPAPRISHDGKPLILRAVRDAGREALVLARPRRATPPEGLERVIAGLCHHLAPLRSETL